jgi:OmpA-OmpF porin, OOP family
MKFLFTIFISSIAIFCNAQLPKIENGKLVLDKAVTFKTGTTELTDEGKEALAQVKEFLTQKDYITTLRVEGHTDNTGVETTNQSLTEKRAFAVCKWLIENGVDCKRLIAVGFGSTKPIASNDTPADKAQNRRIEFIPAAMRGKAIGGMPLDGGGVVAGDLCN